jgi:hypothetical protein
MGTVENYADSTERERRVGLSGSAVGGGFFGFEILVPSALKNNCGPLSRSIRVACAYPSAEAEIVIRLPRWFSAKHVPHSLKKSARVAESDGFQAAKHVETGSLTRHVADTWVTEL